MDAAFTKHLGIPLFPLSTPLRVLVINDRPLISEIISETTAFLSKELLARQPHSPDVPRFCGSSVFASSLQGLFQRFYTYPLSPAKTSVMKVYIQDNHQWGFLQPSSPPAGAGFFLVEKKDGGLCIGPQRRNPIQDGNLLPSIK